MGDSSKPGWRKGTGAETAASVAAQSPLWDWGRGSIKWRFALSVAPNIPALMISIYHVTKPSDRGRDQGRDRYRRATTVF